MGLYELRDVVDFAFANDPLAFSIAAVLGDFGETDRPRFSACYLYCTRYQLRH